MLLQEPVQVLEFENRRRRLEAAIWDALNHYAYQDATFLAERLYAEVSSDDALFLLATCYYRSGYPVQAYKLLQKKGCHTPQCRFLMARCCVDINKSSEAEDLLSGSVLTKVKSLDEIELEFGSMACHVFALLGRLYSKTERPQKATACFKKSLYLNPLLWKSYERLCQMGEKIDPCDVFQVPSQLCSQPLQTQQQPQHSTQPSVPQSVLDVLSPISEALTPSSNEVNMQLPVPQVISMNTTPENQETPMIEKCLTSAPKVCRTKRNLSKPCHALFLSPMTPSFGILPLETPSPTMELNIMPFITPSPLMHSDNQLNDAKAPKKRPSTRKGPNMNPMSKPPVFGINTNTRDGPKPLVGNIPNVRRSSRLFGNSNSSSVKENNKSPEKSRFASPKAVNRKCKPRISKSQQELNEINKSDVHVDTKPATQPELPTVSQLLQMQHQSLSGLLNLLQQLGKGYMYLSQYECRKAIEVFSDLPEHQYYTGWVLTHLGRSHFEGADYKKAEKVFEELRRMEPYYIKGMETYSTTLWHLQREVELSVLAQELTDLDKQSPEAWCATGNCFSLQKEHDVAIKFFQRAIQVDPNFAYAYTLLGHEYVFTEELDKALACFRNAIRVDTRHYNAWYGVGMIYYKQEKFSFAEVHFRKALSINPNSSALLCHIGVVQHAQQKSDSALTTLDRAIAADPWNPLCKFHRASILFANDKHKDALQELEELKTIIPKESLVYFLIGKVHKKLGNTHLALMNFSWAMDLDPKGINNQIKEAIDKRYVTEDDDPLVHLNETAIEEGPSGEASQSNLSDPDLQAIESDESL